MGHGPRNEVGALRVHGRHGENSDESSDKLGDPVRNYFGGRKLARYGEPKRDGGVEVAAGDVSQQSRRAPNTVWKRPPSIPSG
jgi:hypothetical protein